MRNPLRTPRPLLPRAHESLISRKTGAEVPLTGLSFFDRTILYRTEPTNNTAERALRHAVIWRKLCFGTQSDKGSRFVERALTVIETCRIQKRSVFAYVTAAVEAHMASRKSPSLLPAP